MYTLTIYIKTAGQVVLTYKAYELAIKHYHEILTSQLSETTVLTGFELRDDYEHRIFCHKEDVLFVLFTDMDKELECQIELAVKKQRAQMKAQHTFQNDPAARLLQPSSFMPQG